MHEEEGEDADQEYCHKDKRIVEEGIFRPVAFLGMGIEFRKTRSGVGMTFSAGVQDVFLREHRVRIINTEDVVRAVAVRALRHRRIAELGHLAMVRFPVGLDLFGMAVPALLDQREPPQVVLRERRQMLQVAIETGWRHSVFFVKELLPMDAVFIDLEHLRMASGTEVRDLLPAGGRPRIGRGIDVVRSMTGLARRRCRIPRCRGAAVNAHLVFLGLFRRGALPAQEMADAAIYLQHLAVGVPGNIDMALITGQGTVHRLHEEGLIDVPVASFLTMAAQTGIARESVRGKRK